MAQICNSLFDMMQIFTSATFFSAYRRNSPPSRTNSYTSATAHQSWNPSAVFEVGLFPPACRLMSSNLCGSESRVKISAYAKPQYSWRILVKPFHLCKSRDMNPTRPIQFDLRRHGLNHQSRCPFHQTYGHWHVPSGRYSVSGRCWTTSSLRQMSSRVSKLTLTVFYRPNGGLNGKHDPDGSTKPVRHSQSGRGSL